jgi:hypothetical protein
MLILIMPGSHLQVNLRRLVVADASAICAPGKTSIEISNISVRQANADADPHIVSTALEVDEGTRTQTSLQHVSCIADNTVQDWLQNLSLSPCEITRGLKCFSYFTNAVTN